MTDLSSTLSTILVDKYSAKPISQQTAQLNSKLDSFVTEAYQINRSISSLLSYLRHIRQPYLSNAPAPRRTNPKYGGKAKNIQHVTSVPGFGEIPTHLTDTQREEIDSQTAILLRDLNSNVTNLSNAAKLQHDTAQKILEKRYGKPSNFLFRWAAGDADGENNARGKGEQQLNEEGVEKALYGFREGVIWYLNYVLREAVKCQSAMVEIRLERAKEKSMSALYDERNKHIQAQQHDDNEGDYGNLDLRGRDTFNPALDTEGRTRGSPMWNDSPTMNTLSPEQMQLFESENSTLLNYYTDKLAKVTEAEKSLLEISSLQQTLMGHLTVQGEMIGQLVDDAGMTTENLQKGNKELKKASERGSTARSVFWGTVGLCSFLVVWDLIF